MNRKIVSFSLFAAVLLAGGCINSLMSQTESTTKVKPDAIIVTEFGEIKIKLYDDVPGHKANFLKLAKEGKYDSTTFHRVIKSFMIQGGDPNTRSAESRANGGQGGPGYTQPAEIKAHHLHFRGAIAGARMPDQVNPKRESSGSQFYIVTGRSVNELELQGTENSYNQLIIGDLYKVWSQEPEQAWTKTIDWNKITNENPDSAQRLSDQIVATLQQRYPDRFFHYSPEQKARYLKDGGTPHLDMQYTVFGEVIEGMDVVDKIVAVETMPGDRPKKDVFMKVIIP